MKKLLMLWVITLLLVNCNNNTESEKLSSSAVTSEAVESVPPVIYRGALYLGDEAQYLVDCDSKEEWWIEYDAVGNELKNQYEDVAHKPIEIYAEVKGYLEPVPDAKDEFASDYDKVLHITEIVIFNDLDDGNDCTKKDVVN